MSMKAITFIIIRASDENIILAGHKGSFFAYPIKFVFNKNCINLTLAGYYKFLFKSGV